ncbi:unnamed protein product [Rotaria sp. Silwood2]|nr:unnamed protein product [Rotaria sp. Silwood2]CAF4493495.1 unnamed protein product [Rotaria sp. Silwood2]
MLTNMMVALTQVSRTTCAMCDLRTNSMLCNVCKSETRDDFYLLFLTRLKDECNDYFGLQAKCIDMHDAIDHYHVPDTSMVMFDENVHTVDEHAKELLEEHTTISTDEVVPVTVTGDGDCLFHSLQTLYPTMSINELRARCIDELCTHEQYYETIKTEMGLDIVDDESVQNHVLRIINNQQYTGVLTFAALSTVIGQPIESIYPSVNENDAYCEVLNTVFIPRNKQLSSSETPIRIMWSGPEKEVERIWRPNHFTPILSILQPNSAIETTTRIESMDDDVTYVEPMEVPPQTVLRTSRSKITYTSQMNNEIESNVERKNLLSVLDKRQIFLEAPAIIQRMIDAVKEGKVFEQPPKIITHASMFTIKPTEENRLSVGKDGNGIWTQTKSVKTLFILKEPDKYQIVRRDASGKLFYNERVGN